MTIENLKEFFKQIGFNWTGKIENVYNPIPCTQFVPRSFEDILAFCKEYGPVQFYLFRNAKGLIVGEDFEITKDCFKAYKFDKQILDLVRAENYTAAWLEFQKNLQTGNNL